MTPIVQVPAGGKVPDMHVVVAGSKIKLGAPLLTARLVVINGKLLVLVRVTVIGPSKPPAGSLPKARTVGDVFEGGVHVVPVG